VIATYNRLGEEAIRYAWQRGRRHEYLTLEEEKQFLVPFFARAEKGELATAAEIQQALRTCWPSMQDRRSIRLLDRRWLAELMPPPKTSQSDQGVQISLKKLCHTSGRPPSLHASRRRATVLNHGPRRGPIWPDLRPKRCWGPLAFDQQFPHKVVAGVDVCLRCCRSGSGRLLSLSCLQPIQIDDSLPGACQPDAGRLFHRDAGRSSWLASVPSLVIPGQHPSGFEQPPPIVPEVNPIEPFVGKNCARRLSNNRLFTSLDF